MDVRVVKVSAIPNTPVPPGRKSKHAGLYFKANQLEKGLALAVACKDVGQAASLASSIGRTKGGKTVRAVRRGATVYMMKREGNENGR